ncbi:MAG TPA: YceI family protein [Thiobacillaceae bacterium]|nr:YceI family protein [Thiobacillaceae bacterium]
MKWLLSATLLLASPAWCVSYTIDPAHTYPGFEIDHLGFSTQRGQFNRTSGSIELDQLAHTGKLEIHVDIASLDTGQAERDEILKGDEWLQAQRYPEMVYRSERFVFDNDRPVAVEGMLTLLGQTHPLRLEISRFKCGLNLAEKKRGCGADAQGQLRRSDYGLRTGLPFVGNEVKLNIQVEAYLP